MKCRLAQCPSVYPGQISGGAVISAVSVGASGRKAASPIYGIALPIGIGRTGRLGRKCTLGGGMDEARHADVSLWRFGEEGESEVTTTEKQLDTIAGKVSEIGTFDNRPIKVKLEGRGDEWIMFSKPEYRGRWEDPQRGDNAKFGVSRYKDKLYAETCEIQKRGNGPQSTYDAGQVPSGGKELLVLRESCVKSAAPIIAAWVSRLSAEIVFDKKTVSDNVLALAQDFEAWMLREDPPFS